MSASFGARRKAKVIAQPASSLEDGGDEDTGPVVKRPGRPKPKSSRISFAPGVEQEDEDEAVNVIKPKRGLGTSSGISKSIGAGRLPVRQLDDEDDSRPSYSKESLAALKNAQQLRPSESHQETSSSRELDIANKFGRTLTAYERRDASSLIPTDAEIQEKKERRARLVKLAKYNIQPDDSDEANEDEAHDRPDSDEDEFLTQKDKIALRDIRADRSKEPDTRLVRDDEDLMEGFETFTGEDTRVALSEGAQNEAHTKQRAHIQELIDAAQQQSDDEDDASDDGDEHDMRNSYEEAQTRKGLESLRVDGRAHRRQSLQNGARTPPRITPIPTLSACIEKLRGRLMDMETERALKLRRLEELDAERKDIAQREIDLQKLLTETGKEYAQLSREAGVTPALPTTESVSSLQPTSSTAADTL